MRYRFNPFRSMGAARTGAARIETSRTAPAAFHRSLEGYDPTPLQVCPGLAGNLGLGNLYVKDESRRFGLKAFKALGASWALHRQMEECARIGSPWPAVVATATDGNHGRAVAWAARRAGLEAVIFIPAHSVPARVEAIRGQGARVVLVDGTYDEAVDRCAAESARNGWQVIADTGYQGYMEIPLRVAEGYSTLFVESEEQIAARSLPAPDLVIVQGGVGALAAAAVDHYADRPDPPPVLAVVEPIEADCLLESIASKDGQPRPARGRQRSIMAGLNCGRVSLAAWPTLRNGVDLFLSIEDRFAEEAMRRLAHPPAGDPATEAGESGAAGVAGLMALLTDAAFGEARSRLGLSDRSVAMAINTEGATDPESYRRIVGSRPDGTMPADARPGGVKPGGPAPLP
jgi:diaminopropionate ammonia-lyase